MDEDDELTAEDEALAEISAVEAMLHERGGPTHLEQGHLVAIRMAIEEAGGAPTAWWARAEKGLLTVLRACESGALVRGRHGHRS